MTAVDPRKAKFAKRCPRCGYDEWHVMRQHRQCAKCGWKEITVMPVPANAFYEWVGKNDESVVVVKDGVVNPAAQGQFDKASAQEQIRLVGEQLRQAIREAKGEEIIRIPPQPHYARYPFEHDIDPKTGRCVVCGLGKKEILIERPPCRPGFVPSTSWADNGSNPLDDVQKMNEAIWKSMGVPKHILEGTEPPVFCGTTGDKEHVKDRALREPTSDALEPDARCCRCSRLVATCQQSQETYVCPMCIAIERNDAPLAKHLPKDEATPLWLVEHERAIVEARRNAMMGPFNRPAIMENA